MYQNEKDAIISLMVLDKLKKDKKIKHKKVMGCMLNINVLNKTNKKNIKKVLKNT